MGLHMGALYGVVAAYTCLFNRKLHSSIIGRVNHEEIYRSYVCWNRSAEICALPPSGINMQLLAWYLL